MTDLVNDMTERFLRDAGIAPGMRVLDVGCGRGDVSFLVARIARASESREGGLAESARGVAFHPTGDWAAWAGHRVVQLLDRRGQERLRLDAYDPRGAGDIEVCFTRDGSLLVANRHGDVRVRPPTLTVADSDALTPQRASSARPYLLRGRTTIRSPDLRMVIVRLHDTGVTLPFTRA